MTTSGTADGPWRVFAGPGEMRARARAMDWAATPLGPIEGWSASLRTAVGLLLASPLPGALLWGPALVQLHNDAAIPHLGAHHARAFGAPTDPTAPGPLGIDGTDVARTLAGETVTVGAREAESGASVARFGVPVPDDAGDVGGVLVTLVPGSSRSAEGSTAVERGTARLLALHAITESLARALTASEVARAVAAHAVPALGADSSQIALLVDGGTTFALVGHEGLPGDVAGAWERFPADLPVPVRDATVRGEPVLLRTAEAIRDRYPHAAPVLEQLGAGALAVVPVVFEERAAGAMTFVFGAPRAFAADEVAFMRGVASQAAQALERSRLFEGERAARIDAERAVARLGEQTEELELQTRHLHEQAAELEVQAEQLHATVAELEARTEDAERARRESHAARRRLLETLESITDPFFTLDTGWRFTYVNPAAAAVVGRDRAELLGRTLWEEFPATVGTAYQENTMLAARERRAVDYEAYYPPPLDLWTAVRVYPLGTAEAPEGVAVYYQNVTPRKRAEAALAESERQFRTLADAIPTLAWTARPDGYIDWYNARWYEYTGTTPPEMQGWGWQAVHDPVTLPDVLAGWTGSIASGDTFEMTFPLRGADGRFRRFLTRVVPVRDAAGTVVRWFGTNTDVEVERAARELAESSAARATLLQDLATALSQSVTREDVAAAVADRVAPALGATLGVVALVTPNGDRLAATGADRWDRQSWLAWRSFPTDADVPLARAARERRPVLLPTFDDIAARAPAVVEVCRESGVQALVAVPVVTADGRVLGSLGLSYAEPRAFGPALVSLLETVAAQAAQAIERARLLEAERAARADAEAAEMRLRDVFEQAPVAVAVLTGPEHVYSVVSPLYAETPGGGRPLLGRAVREAFPELRDTGYPETMDRVFETGEPFFAAERQVLLARGSEGELVEHFFNVGYQPLRDGAGRVYAIASVAYDVTSQVRARREVEAARAEAERQRAAAVEANRAKSEFLSTMSHELRTPLNAIQGYTELLMLELRGPLTAEQRQDMERIRRANQHLTALVTDILNFARLEAGQVEFRVSDVDLDGVIADLEPLVGPQLAARGLTFAPDSCASDGGRRIVRADAEKLRQVLLNLLTNAIKFTEPGGHVALGCDADPAAGVTRIHVSDTGRGIPLEQHARIFEPFVQVDRHRTHESQQGVGLGLAISRDLARGMGGELTVVSEEGRGSTFTVVLQLVAPPADHPDDPDDRRSTADRRRDDDRRLGVERRDAATSEGATERPND